MQPVTPMCGQTCELTKEIKMSIIAHPIVMVDFMMVNNNYKLITFIDNPLYNLIIYDKILGKTIIIINKNNYEYWKSFNIS